MLLQWRESEGEYQREPGCANERERGRERQSEREREREREREHIFCIRGAQERRAREIYRSCLHLHHKSSPFKLRTMEQYKTQQIEIQENLSTHQDGAA